MPVSNLEELLVFLAINEKRSKGFFFSLRGNAKAFRKEPEIRPIQSIRQGPGTAQRQATGTVEVGWGEAYDQATSVIG